MEANKSVLVRVFSEQCEELYLDLTKVFPKNFDIKTGLTIVQTAKRFNPKILIKKYKTAVNDPYYEKVMKGDLEFFLNKDYREDCINLGYVGNEIKSQNDWLDGLKKLYSEIAEDERNVKKLKKYFQNLSKICKMYYS